VQSYSQLFRQNIVLSKFQNIDLQATLDQYCSSNVFGRVSITKLQPNRAVAVAKDLKLSMTLKRIPPVASFEHADEARFQLFVKTLWQDIYEKCTGYTVVLIPSYFDYVRLRNYIRDKN
jgi:U3 small nucleolar RNA-associated protein 25